jgi:hypothetical protein
MKTLTRKGSGISLYIFDDAEFVSVGADKTVVGDPERLVIYDCNSSSVSLHEDVTPPEDWFGWKYFFDGTTWTQNPDWVDPSVE